MSIPRCLILNWLYPSTVFLLGFVAQSIFPLRPCYYLFFLSSSLLLRSFSRSSDQLPTFICLRPVQRKSLRKWRKRRFHASNCSSLVRLQANQSESYIPLRGIRYLLSTGRTDLDTALCRICEPIAFMSIFPYVYYMVASFKVTADEHQIAIYAGLVTSSFAFAEFSTGVLWGRISDRVGRKPILLTGLAGTGLSMLVFGFAPSLPVALLARALGGLLNGYVRFLTNQSLN